MKVWLLFSYLASPNEQNPSSFMYLHILPHQTMPSEQDMVSLWVQFLQCVIESSASFLPYKYPASYWLRSYRNALISSTLSTSTPKECCISAKIASSLFSMMALVKLSIVDSTMVIGDLYIVILLPLIATVPFLRMRLFVSVCADTVCATACIPEIGNALYLSACTDRKGMGICP